eukprot:1661258-Rhodomonas_salina.2
MLAALKLSVRQSLEVSSADVGRAAARRASIEGGEELEEALRVPDPGPGLDVCTSSGYRPPVSVAFSLLCAASAVSETDADHVTFSRKVWDWSVLYKVRNILTTCFLARTRGIGYPVLTLDVALQGNATCSRRTVGSGGRQR